MDTAQLIWIGMALIGLVLLLMSAFGVGADADTDLSHDLSTDAGVSPLSLPIIATFMATSGAVGAAMSFGGFDTATTTITAGVVGTATFVAVYGFMAYILIPSQGTSSIQEKEYEGKTGTVTETISEGGIGAVAVTLKGIRNVVSARSEGGKIPMGTEVIVRRISDSVATVEEVRKA
jgi:membrane protein implicated in regulation of membrane protease activity